MKEAASEHLEIASHAIHSKRDLESSECVLVIIVPEVQKQRQETTGKSWQDRHKRTNIVQAFRPDPSSPSFCQPKTEMNIASGCPKFAPLSVLSHLSYVKNDTL